MELSHQPKPEPLYGPDPNNPNLIIQTGLKVSKGHYLWDVECALNYSTNIPCGQVSQWALSGYPIPIWRGTYHEFITNPTHGITDKARWIDANHYYIWQ